MPLVALARPRSRRLDRRADRRGWVAPGRGLAWIHCAPFYADVGSQAPSGRDAAIVELSQMNEIVAYSTLALTFRRLLRRGTWCARPSPGDAAAAERRLRCGWLRRRPPPLLDRSVPSPQRQAAHRVRRYSGSQHIALPSVNLGASSFMDAVGGPGLLVRQAIEVYEARRSVGSNGADTPGSNTVSAFTSITHVAYAAPF
jgi:hypothetical protein